MMNGDDDKRGACRRQASFDSPLVRSMHNARLNNMDDYPEFYYG